MNLLYQPVTHGVVLGGEEHYGRVDEGKFVEADPLDGQIRRIAVLEHGLGLQLPCLAEILDDSGEAVATAELEVVSGRIVCSSISALPGHGLTGNLLRQVPLARLINDAAENNIVHLRDGFAVRFIQGAWGVDLPKLGGRRRIDDDFLVRVAVVYREAVSLGLTPALAVRRALGPTSHGNARRWIMQARRRGFLGAAPGPRRAGEAHGSS